MQIISVIQFYSGSEVAQYASTHLPGLLKERVSWKRGDYKEAIKEAFLEFDNLLRFFYFALNIFYHFLGFFFLYLHFQIARCDTRIKSFGRTK